MYVGSANPCFKVDDLERSVRFYEALGLERVPDAGTTGQSAYVRRGHFSLFLMTFGVDSLNFRGADAFDVHEHLRSQKLDAAGKPERQEDGGTQWMTEDPDGHGIFFNTHAHEATPAYRQERVARVLQATEQELVDLGASEECLSAFREVRTRFGST